MKAVILARVSSKEQEEGHSLDAQIRNLELYAGRNSLKIVEKFTVIESSTKGDRPDFTAMIDFIKGYGEKLALVVDTVDRLQRSFTETPLLNELLSKDIVELHFVKEANVLTKESSSTQKLMWNMGVVMAQSYTDQLSDNVKRSIKHKVNKGEWSGAAPLGYLNIDDELTGQKTIIPDPERAFLIKRLFADYASKAYSQADLIRHAKEWGLTTKKGNPVSPQTFSDILRNPFYYGVMRVKGELYPHIYDPIITKELFDQCEDIRTGRKNAQVVTNTKHEFLFRGMLKCAASGRTVSCDLKKKKHVYLICRNPDDKSKKLFIPESVALEQVRNVFESIQIPEQSLEAILSHLRTLHDSEKDFHHQTIKALHKESQQLAKKQDQILELLMDKSITKDAYDRKETQLLNRRVEINEQLERHHTGNEQFKIALSSLLGLTSNIAELFDRSKTDEKRQLIGYMFSNLELEGSKLRYTLRKPFDLFADLAVCKEWLPGPDSNQRPND